MKHLPKAHYVRQILEQAAEGSLPTSSQLDKLNEFDLPDGENLSRYRASINSAAQRIVAQRQESGYGAAFKVAGDECHGLAQRMSDTQLAATRDPNPESYEDLTARMFGR